MPDAKKRSVIKRPSYEESPTGGWILSLSSMADEFPAWGADPAGLDLKIREFWPTESYLQSAIYAIATRNAAFSWTLQGPPSTVEACQEFLVENWVDFCYKWNLDYLTQNNGAFVEIIRLTDSPDSPCIGINQLDAARCRRTGVDEWPVVYSDRLGGQHRLAPHQVWVMADMPSPIETMNSVGMCAVYRILCEAKRMRDISVYEREKLSGFNPKSLYIVGNVGKTQLTDVLKEHEQNQLQKGYVRYVKPAIMGVLDPKAPATVATLDFASIPDGFDKDKELKWYITVMALALGCDYQDLAPLSAGNLGTSTQSEVLHLKSKGKGPAMYMKRISHMMNFSGILPKNVTFEFDEKDIADDTQIAALDKLRADTRAVYFNMGVYTPESIRQEMVDTGEMTEEMFKILQATPDATPEVTTEDESQQADGETQTDEQQKGGEGSGNYGHEGRPGEVGGSGPGGGGSSGVDDYSSDSRFYVNPPESKRPPKGYLAHGERGGDLVLGQGEEGMWVTNNVEHAGSFGDKVVFVETPKNIKRSGDLVGDANYFRGQGNKIETVDELTSKDWGNIKSYYFKKGYQAVNFGPMHNDQADDIWIFKKPTVHILKDAESWAAWDAGQRGEGGGRASSVSKPRQDFNKKETKAKQEFAAKLRAKLEKRMADQMAVTLKKVLGLFKRPLQDMKSLDKPSDLLNDPDLWKEVQITLRQGMTPLVRQVLLESLNYNLDMGLVVDMNAVNPAILQYTRRFVNDWGQYLESSIRGDISEAIATWQESGLGKRGFPDLVKALDEVVFSKTRAQNIATTEITRIFDQGNRLVEKAAGIEEQEWQTVREGNVCKVCEELDGKTFAIDSPPYPVDDTHIGCRCERVGIGRAG